MRQNLRRIYDKLAHAEFEFMRTYREYWLDREFTDLRALRIEYIGQPKHLPDGDRRGLLVTRRLESTDPYELDINEVSK